MQKMVKPIRLVVLAVVFVLLLGVYFVALYKLQIIGGREYYAVGETETKEDITIAAARGNILDRYGRLLVSNSLCNNLSINVTELFSQDDPNAVILELCSAVERFGDTYTDTLPITKAPPFEFTEMDTLQKSMLDAWLKANDMPLDSSAVEILAATAPLSGIEPVIRLPRAPAVLPSRISDALTVAPDVSRSNVQVPVCSSPSGPWYLNPSRTLPGSMVSAVRSSRTSPP